MNYCIRFQRREKLAVRPVMFLLNETKKAKNIYSGDNFHFVFDLIKMFDLEASQYKYRNDDLLPFVVLMGTAWR